MRLSFNKTRHFHNILVAMCMFAFTIAPGGCNRSGSTGTQPAQAAAAEAEHPEAAREGKGAAEGESAPPETCVPAAPDSGSSAAACAPQSEGESGSHVPDEEGVAKAEEEEEDVPLDELEKRQCEHNIPQLECDECRYELGAVKVPGSIVGTLLKTATADESAMSEMLIPLRCEVRADETRSVPVVAPLSGRVRQVMVALGAPVKAGDVLAVLYSDDFVEVKKTHMSAHRSATMAKAKLERLMKVQADLQRLMQRFNQPEPLSSSDPVLADLKVGKDMAAIVGSYSDLATARSQYEQQMKAVADTRILLARMEGKEGKNPKAGGPPLGQLGGGAWKETLLTAQVELRLAQKVHQRAKTMVAGGIASRAELEQAERDLDIARVKFTAAIESVRMAVNEAEVRVTNQLNATQAVFKSAVDDVGLRVDIERLEAQQDLDRADAETAATHRRLALLGVPEDQMEVATDGDSSLSAYLELRSPANGVILEQSIRVGQTVEAGASLFSVADLAQVWVWCDVYDRELGNFQTTRPPFNALVSIASAPGRSFPGVLDYVGQLMSEDTRTVRVRVVTPNREGLLRPGMFASADVKIPLGSGKTTVPEASVFSDEGRSFVFVPFKGDFWVRRTVTVGRRLGDKVEILAGVAPGATVAADGGFLLKSDVLRSKMGAGCAD